MTPEEIELEKIKIRSETIAKIIASVFGQPWRDDYDTPSTRMSVVANLIDRLDEKPASRPSKP